MLQKMPDSVYVEFQHLCLFYTDLRLASPSSHAYIAIIVIRTTLLDRRFVAKTAGFEKKSNDHISAYTQRTYLIFGAVKKLVLTISFTLPKSKYMGCV